MTKPKLRTIDRRLPGIGRLRKQIGRVSPRTFEVINTRLDQLADVGDLETLRKIRDGMIALIELVQMDRPKPTSSHADFRVHKRRSLLVYAILRPDTQQVKIGIAVDVQARMEALQTASACKLELIGIIEGGRQRELALHRQFAALHIRGEWFRASDDLLAAFRETDA
jgi:hypothetical protein